MSDPSARDGVPASNPGEELPVAAQSGDGVTREGVPGDDLPREAVTSDRVERARVRRSPRYGVFFVLGGALGVLAAMIITFTWTGGAAEPKLTAGGMSYSTIQIFGFTLIYLVPIGVALGAVVALVLDRVVGRRSREVIVDHERVDED
ncbi:hypothetical protein [uncultured Microbacterium sp.]|uniref:hypothetical protein n=1 Tax=uncultured Microbacterium sp. TaxID=191216 RepID=UPI0025E17455|nr:hypothetical protein [uncultured Microbacterium sp.]